MSALLAFLGWGLLWWIVAWLLMHGHFPWGWPVVHPRNLLHLLCHGSCDAAILIAIAPPLHPRICLGVRSRRILVIHPRSCLDVFDGRLLQEVWIALCGLLGEVHERSEVPQLLGILVAQTSNGFGAVGDGIHDLVAMCESGIGD